MTYANYHASYFLPLELRSEFDRSTNLSSYQHTISAIKKIIRVLLA
jgi:hypothetical protein